MEKSVIAVNSVATSDTDRPMGPAMSLLSTSGMTPALHSGLSADKQALHDAHLAVHTEGMCATCSECMLW